MAVWNELVREIGCSNEQKNGMFTGNFEVLVELFKAFGLNE